MPDERTCPCCGRVRPPQNIVTVDLNENRLIFNGKSVHLGPRLAELAHILGKCMPGLVAHESVCLQLWGGSDTAPLTARDLVYRLRRTIHPLGLDIVNVREMGYGMSIVSGTEKIRYRKSTGEQHASA